MTHAPQRLAALTPAQADAVRRLAADVTRADGVAPFDEQTLLTLDAGSTRAATHLLLEQDGELLGYAQVADGSGELAVALGARRQGRGRALLRAARAVRSDSAAPALWAHGDLPPARALAAAERLTRTRELLRMATELPAADPASIPPVPAGLRIETFSPERHADAWVRLNARSFAAHPEQGRLTRADLDQRTAQDWFDPELLLLAYDAGDGTEHDDGAEAAADPIGFIWMKPGEEADAAELYVLGVDPAAQGRGLGRDLTARGLAEVAVRGRTRVDLYVDGDNTPALATYERQGFAVVERHSQYR